MKVLKLMIFLEFFFFGARIFASEELVIFARNVDTLLDKLDKALDDENDEESFSLLSQLESLYLEKGDRERFEECKKISHELKGIFYRKFLHDALVTLKKAERLGKSYEKSCSDNRRRERYRKSHSP